MTLNKFFKSLALQKTRLFFLIFLLFYSIPSIGKVYLKLNIHDCAKCSLLLNSIHDIAELDTLFVVVPNNLQEEADEMKRNLGLNKFSKLQYIFSDSLFDYFNKYSNRRMSELEIIRNERIVYNTPLDPVYLDIIQLNIVLDKTNTICPEPQIKRMQNEALMFGHYAITLDNYKNVTVFNLLTKKHWEISMDKKENLEFIYKNLYKSSFENKFPIIEKQIKEYPKFKPDIFQGYVMLGDEQVLLSYNPSDFKANGTDTSIFESEILLLYDLKQEKFVKAFNKDESAAFAAQSLNRIMYLDNKLFGLFSGKSKGPMFYQLKLDAQKGIYTTDTEPLPRSYPSNYFKRVSDIYSLDIKTSNHTVLHSKADSIYSLYHKKMIKIPFENLKGDLSLIQNGENFYSPTTGNFYLRYALEGENYEVLYYLSFNEKGERVDFKAFQNNKQGPSLFLNPYEFIQFNNKDKCFKRKSIFIN